MKWFKHDSNANTDAKLKRVRMKYGMQGYGLYWYCLELIAQNIDKHNLTFELEHDSEIIAFDTGINYQLVEEMITFMVNLELFRQIDGKIYCLKMLKRMDQSMTSDAEMRRLLINAKQNHDEVMTQSTISHDVVMKEENRTDKNRTDKKREGNKPKRFTPPTEEEVSQYCREMGYTTIDPIYFIDYQTARDWRLKGGQKMKCWKATIRTWVRNDRQKQSSGTRGSSLEQDLTDTSWAH